MMFIGTSWFEHCKAGYIRTFHPTKNVEELSFAIYGDKCNDGPLPLNKLFSKLHQLELSLYSNINYSYIVCEFSHLDHLTLSISNPDAWSRADQIEMFLAKNSHIRNVEIHFTPQLSISLAEISKLLPNIENLTLHNTLELFNETAHFDHVKNSI